MIGRLTRGLLALLALAALLFGVPAALLLFGGHPLQGWPELSQWGSMLTSPDDGTLLLALAKGAGWLGWAVFVVSTAVETAAAVRRVPAPRLPALGMPQTLARTLVGAVVAMVTVAGVGTTAEAVQVEPGDTLSGLAAEHLGDERAWTDLLAANPQITDPDLLHPGQRLTIPGAAELTAPARGEDTTDAEPTVVTVRPGDTLSGLAAEYLGDGDEWPRVAAANPQIADPHLIFPGQQVSIPDAPGSEEAPGESDDAGADDLGAEVDDEGADSDDSTPGDDAPEDGAPNDGEGEESGSEGDGGASEDAPPGDAPIVGFPPLPEPAAERQELSPDADDDAADEPSPTEDTSRDRGTGAAQTGAQLGFGPGGPPVAAMSDQRDAPDQGAASGNFSDTTVDTADSDATGASEQSEPTGLTTVGLAAVSAVGVLGLLAAARLAQSRRRRPGRRIAMPTGEAAQLEVDLRAQQDRAAVADGDRALRALATWARAGRVVMPELRAARITARNLELYLVDPSVHLPSPFTSTGDDGSWVIDRGAVADLEPDEEIAAPCPTLVTIGQDPLGGWVLLNLEQIGALSVTGERAAADAVLAALVVELVGSRWADDLRVSLVGVMDDLAEALQSDRVEYAATLEDVLAREVYAGDVHSVALKESGHASAAAARVSDDVTESWTPHLLVLAQEPTAEQARQLTHLLQRTPRLALATLSAVTTRLSPWVLALDGSMATLHPGGVEVQPQRLEGQAYAALVKAFATTTKPDVPGPSWTGTMLRDNGSKRELGAGEPELWPGQAGQEREERRDHRQTERRGQRGHREDGGEEPQHPARSDGGVDDGGAQRRSSPDVHGNGSTADGAVRTSETQHLADGGQREAHSNIVETGRPEVAAREGVPTAAVHLPAPRAERQLTHPSPPQSSDAGPSPPQAPFPPQATSPPPGSQESESQESKSQEPEVADTTPSRPESVRRRGRHALEESEPAKQAEAAVTREAPPRHGRPEEDSPAVSARSDNREAHESGDHHGAAAASDASMEPPGSSAGRDREAETDAAVTHDSLADPGGADPGRADPGEADSGHADTSPTDPVSVSSLLSSAAAPHVSFDDLGALHADRSSASGDPEAAQARDGVAQRKGGEGSVRIDAALRILQPPHVADAAAASEVDRDGEGDSVDHGEGPGSRTAPRLRLLGPVAVERARGKRPQSPGRITELIAFLALHPADTPEALDAALWPGKRVRAATRNVPVSQARHWLGLTDAGEPFLPYIDAAGGYRLHRELETDWAVFTALVGDEIATTPTADLVAALRLVDGQPLTVKDRYYAWAEADKQDMIAAVGDVALEIALRSLASGDGRQAAWASAKGTTADPANEALWRAQLRAARLSGVPGQVQRIAEAMHETLDEIGGDLEPETAELLQSLLAPKVRQPRSSGRSDLAAQ